MERWILTQERSALAHKLPLVLRAHSTRVLSTSHSRSSHTRRHPTNGPLPLCHVDKKSLLDLGILPNAAGEWPLRNLLDHTHSKTAARVLETLLANPLDNRADILARQQLLRVLPRITQQLDWKLIDELIRSTTNYLDSSFVVVPPTAFDATVFALQYRNIAKFVETHIATAAKLLEICASLYEQLKPIESDKRFRQSLEPFELIFDTTLRTEVRAAIDSTTNRRLNICRMDSRFRVHLREPLLKLVASLHEIDAFCSLAKTAANADLTFPSIATDQHAPFVLEGLRHPMVKDAQANSIELNASERVMFLTGPNMAGKSTLLRTLGIVVVFAHLGLPVPATKAAIPAVDRLIASLGNEDNILRAESLYLAEVRRVKRVAAAVASGELVVALLDEVFRGTNVKDAADATTLLVSGLARSDFGLFAVSSHLIEVATEQQGKNGVGNWHMQVESHNDSHTFTYKLERGVSEVRLGMMLLEREGVVGLLERIGRTGPPMT